MDFAQAKFNMVEQQIRPWLVSNPQLLTQLNQLSRENFVPKEYKELAFSDVEIPLPGKQHMLFPKVEARLIQELKVNPQDKILEIGTGSGFVTAILAKLGKFVDTIEINEHNLNLATHNLKQASISNVKIHKSNGLDGILGQFFDKIFIGGGINTIPQTLINQLNIGGKIVAICGQQPVMHAILIEKPNATTTRETRLFETSVEYLLGETNNSFNL